MSDFRERFSTPAHPDGCPVLITAALLRAEAEVRILRKSLIVSHDNFDKVYAKLRELLTRAEKAEARVSKLEAGLLNTIGIERQSLGDGRIFWANVSRVKLGCAFLRRVVPVSVRRIFPVSVSLVTVREKLGGAK